MAAYPTAARECDNSTSQQDLFDASKRGDLTEVKRLLEADCCSVNGCNSNGWTALYYASWNGHSEVARFLLDSGADTNRKTDYGTTALHIACISSHVDAVRVLLEYGADVNAVNKNGETPLHDATIRGDVDVVRLLLRHGAASTLYSKDGDGETPLHYASTYGHTGVIEFLIENQLDLNPRNIYGDTALHTCSRKDRPTTAILLIEKGRMNVNERNYDGHTALHLTTTLRMARVLVERGASLTAQNSHDQTPLERARRTGLQDVARFLEFVATYRIRQQVYRNKLALDELPGDQVDTAETNHVALAEAPESLLALSCWPRVVYRISEQDGPLLGTPLIFYCIRRKNAICGIEEVLDRAADPLMSHMRQS